MSMVFTCRTEKIQTL